MDIIFELGEALYEALGRKAIAIFAAVGGAIALCGFLIRGHYSHQVALCNTGAGHLAQFFSGGARVNCGFAGFMSKVGLGVGIVGLLVAAAMGVWFVRTADRPAVEVPTEPAQPQ
ncbi:MAG: hypothetical protein ACJ76I_15795 [Gaiellaceae bacterium]